MADTPQTTSKDFGATRNGGSRRTAPYYAIIGQPPKCKPGDTETARAYAERIDKALSRGSWSPTHANRLRELRRLWRFRASGQDLRFNLVGTRDGRLPLEVETVIRQTRDSRLKALKKRLQPQDGRLRPYFETHDGPGDLPRGKAQGYGGLGDTGPEQSGMSDSDDPEAGPAWTPGPREYIIPGQDSHGHSQRVYCKVMPAHHRALSILKDNKTFGFRSIGDVFRWCLVRGIEELNLRAKSPAVHSAMHQAEAIAQVLIDQAYYQDYAKIFEAMSEVIQKHSAKGETGQAARLVGQIRSHIEGMQEPFWRELWMTELQNRFGSYLDTKGATFNLEGENE